MSDNNLTGRAESHSRNISWSKSYDRQPLFNRGGQTRGIQFVDQGVPYFLHDYYGPGRHAKIVSTSLRQEQDKLIVTGISHDNGMIISVTVNGQAADRSPQIAGVVDWRIELPAAPTIVIAIATDEADNMEQTGHRVALGVPVAKK